MRAALLALVVLLGLPASATAAPPWSAPRDVSGPHTFVDGLWADVGLIGWRSEDGEAGAPAGRVFEPVFYGSGSGAVALVRRNQLRVAFARPGGLWGRSTRLFQGRRIASPVLAGNARDDLAVAWFEDRGTFNDRVYVALKRAGRAFGRPLRLATGRIRSVSVAIGSRGDVLVAWDARGKIRTRFRRRGRRAFGPAETLRSDPAFFAALRTGVASSGRAYVAWAAQFLTEGGERGPGFYDAAVRPAGAARFRRAQRLERIGSDRQIGTLDLELSGRGRAIVAWTGDRVRAAETDAGARFGPPRDLSGPGAGLTDVVASSEGLRLVAWTAPGPLVQAAYAPPGGPFGVPEDVAPGEGARASLPGPSLAWIARGPGGVRVQEAVRTG
jgi:hypothetical protein